jgi:uncharacterized phage protein gp47/JayE
LGSSTYIRIVADAGTEYLRSIHTFVSKSGIEFQLDEDVVVGNHGYLYAKVSSVGNGAETNIAPLTIDEVSPIPSGHQYVVNEYQAIGERDEECDYIFRQRIQDGPNILARGTIAMLEQALNKLNSNVLRVQRQRINDNGNIVVAIITQNGAALGPSELDDLLNRVEEFLALTEMKPYGTQSYGIEFINIEWQEIDVSFRLELYNNANPDTVRDDIQRAMTQYLDFRFWRSGDQKIEWDNLLQIVKGTRGVKYVPDQYFVPGVDIQSERDKLPRIRGFRMLNLSGSVINDTQGILMPVFYPAKADFNYQNTILASI